MTWRILVIDDEKSYCDLLARALAREDFRVKTAQEGEAAAAALLEGSVDLLITDLNMPGLTGYDLVELARRVPNSPRILVITAQKSALEETSRRLKNLHCLLKPFSLADFRAKVGLLTGRWEESPGDRAPLPELA